jgi:hypothetical protein
MSTTLQSHTLVRRRPAQVAGVAVALIVAGAAAVSVALLGGDGGSISSAPAARGFQLPSHAVEHGGAPVPDLRGEAAVRTRPAAPWSPSDHPLSERTGPGGR